MGRLWTNELMAGHPKIYRKHAAFHAKPMPSRSGFDTSTGVRGIRMQIVPVKPGRCRAYPVLLLWCYDIETGERIQRSRNVSRNTISMHYHELMTVLRKAKGLKSIPKHWKTTNPPTVRRFNALVRAKERHGIDVEGALL